MLSPNEYATKLATDLTRITMTEFFKSIHLQFYPDQDISFMEYFLELCEHDGEFYVHHSKLLEYGIMTSTQSSDVKKKLDQLMIVEGSDFELRHVSELRKQGGTSDKKEYYLSPEAFKKCLMRAQRRAKQPIDPVIYCNYYLLLEKVHKLYTDYERLYSNKLLSMKDDKIDALLEEVKDQSQKIDNLTKMNTDQSAEIAELLGYSKSMKKTVTKNNEEIKLLNNTVTENNVAIKLLNKKIDVLFDFMLSFARMTLPTWIGSSVMKTQLDKLTSGKSLSYGLKHMKVMFVVSFYTPYEKTRRVMINDKKISYRALMKHYFCCTNFADVGARIKELNKRHEEEYYMLEPRAICLISCEINIERVTLSSMRHLFPEDANVTYLDKYKAFDVEITTRLYSKISTIYDTMVDKSRKERFQMYQTRIDEYIGSQSFNENILKHINEADEVFYESTLPFCQNYINCYLAKSVDEDDNFIEWTYHVSPKNSNVKTRKDLGNKRVNNLVYPLHKIKSIIDNYSETDDIGEMVKTGIICKNDIESMKAIAKIENVDISHVQFPVEEDY